MMEGALSRRAFACHLGTALGAALVVPSFVQSLTAVPPPAPRQRVGPGDGVIRLDSNENPYGPSPKALEAMTRSQRVAARYPDSLEERMREALAKLHGVEPDNVLLGCGSSEILRMADMAFLGSGKNVVVAEPTFEAVLAYARVTRAQRVKVALTADFRHDLDRMAAACNEATGLVYVCNPNNPTGTIVTRDELVAFLGRVPQSTIILVDEAYHHFVEDPCYASAFEWLGQVPNLVLARTFSKVYGMAGMRLGYAVGTKENIRAMREHVLSNNANAAVLEAGLASLADPGHIPQQRKLNNDTRHWLCSELERDARRYIPSEANFVMIDVGGDVKPVIEQFHRRRILVGRKFPSLGNWLRVSIGTRRETQAFLAALREIVPTRAKVASGRAA
ncbi:MAG: histidinol-phosphate transaminase [Acidobacteria bacterium]|nr:histidinol-phosphate transaminase [Acidobacteriota bacterium]